MIFKFSALFLVRGKQDMQTKNTTKQTYNIKKEEVVEVQAMNFPWGKSIHIRVSKE